MKRLDRTELIFRILSYVLVILFTIATLYPFLFSIAMAISGETPINNGEIILFPKDIQFKAVLSLLVGDNSKQFWIAYTNTLFYTLYGTLFSMIISIFAAYALSRTHLVFKRQIGFFIVFTMWFSAGLIPAWLNYRDLYVNNRWGIIYGFGAQAFNILLLRNYFQGISKEIEEAAIVDGANEFQVLGNIYLPMSKSALATITLFYALNRWNGYFWNRQLVHSIEHPLQVVLQAMVAGASESSDAVYDLGFSMYSMAYSAIILSIIPIVIVYPYLQKYFARGVNVGGVKE